MEWVLGKECILMCERGVYGDIYSVVVGTSIPLLMPSAGRALNPPLPPVRVLCSITSSPKMASLASFTASVDALAGTQSFELALITSDTDWRPCGALLAGTVLS